MNPMNLRIAVTVAALLASSTVFSAITLNVPEEIKIVAVNDQEVNAGLLRKNQSFKLNAGINRINVRYTEYFQHVDSSHDILKSGVVSLQTPALQDGQEYRLALINAPQSFEAAQLFKKQPIIGLYDQNNQLIIQQIGVSESVQPLLGKTLSTKTIDLTMTSGSTPVQPTTSLVAKQQISNGQEPIDVIKQDYRQQSNVSALQKLWKQASTNERREFMAWLADQVE